MRGRSIVRQSDRVRCEAAKSDANSVQSVPGPRFSSLISHLKEEGDVGVVRIEGAPGSSIGFSDHGEIKENKLGILVQTALRRWMRAFDTAAYPSTGTAASGQRRTIARLLIGRSAGCC